MITWPDLYLPPINLYSYPKTSFMRTSPINRSLLVGDLIQDSNNKIWVIVEVDRNIAFYSKSMDSEIEDCFIFRFNTNSKELSYNSLFRLIIKEDI